MGFYLAKNVYILDEWIQWLYLERSRLTRTRLEILLFPPSPPLARSPPRYTESPWNVPGGSLVSSRPPNAIRASLDLTGLNHRKGRSWTFSSCDQLPRASPRIYTILPTHLIVPPLPYAILLFSSNLYGMDTFDRKCSLRYWYVGIDKILNWTKIIALELLDEFVLYSILIMIQFVLFSYYVYLSCNNYPSDNTRYVFNYRF